ncbi:hypothetical protein ISX56_28925, partial [Serratia ureilytica]|nr:hypothetical protein [Serratia ureilytica]
MLNHRFLDIDGTPSFGIRQPAGRVTVCDLSHHADPEALAWRAMEQITQREQGPENLHLHEHQLYVLNEREAIWFSRIHHIAFDASPMPVKVMVLSSVKSSLKAKSPKVTCTTLP